MAHVFWSVSDVELISGKHFDIWPQIIAGRGGGGTPNPQTVFPELPANAQSQQAELWTLLLYIQGGPDDIFKISGQVRSLTYDLWPLHGQNGQNGKLLNQAS